MSIQRTDNPYLVYSVSVPPSGGWDAPRAHQFMEQMTFAFGTLIFRIEARPERIVWQIVDLVGFEQQAIESAIHTSYPDASISIAPFGAEEISDTPIYRRVIAYQYRTPIFVAPILAVEDISAADPLASLTHAMSNLRAGERILYTVAVEGIAPYALREGQKLLERPIYTGSVVGLLFPPKVDRYVPHLQRVLIAKLQQRLYQACVLIQIDSPDQARLQSLLVVDNHMVHFDRPEFNGLQWIDEPITHRVVQVTDNQVDFQTSAIGLFATLASENDLSRPMQQLRQAMRLVLDGSELSSLWHLPHVNCTAPTIHWSHPHVRLPARMVGAREGLLLGTNQYVGNAEPVYLPASDRSGHLSIIGKAGVGKSTLMHHLIHQDIAQNRGVAVFDPHGALISDILRCSIPAHREKDVVILDIANEAFPPPLNLLALPSGAAAGDPGGQMMTVLNTIYNDFHATPTVADAFSAGLTTALAGDTPTLRDLPRLFSDPVYRATLLSKVENPAVQEFWEHYERLSAAQQTQLQQPVVWRVRNFYSNSVLYPMLCHPDPLPLSSFIAQNKIVLVSLKANEARLPSREQQLLGLILMLQLRLAVMLRPVGSTPYYLYLDEAQKFVTTPLETLLSEVRKFGLSLVLANQYLKQLAGDTLDALMGNIGAVALFQCGLDDAKALAPYLTPGFDVERLINLNKYEAAVKMRYHDQTQPAFSLNIDTPLKAQGDGAAREQYLRDLSIKRYTPKSRGEVIAWLKERYAPSSGNANPSEMVSDFEPSH